MGRGRRRPAAAGRPSPPPGRCRRPGTAHRGLRPRPGGHGAGPDLAPHGLQDRFPRAVLQQHAAAQKQNRAGDVLDIRNNVGRKDHGALRAEPGDQVAEPHPLLGVQAGGRLVEHKQRRVAEQRLRDAEPLAHPARKGPDFAVLPHRPGRLPRAAQGSGCGRPRGAAPERGEVEQEIERCELGVIAEILRQIAEPGAVALARHIEAGELDAARRWPQHAADHAQQRRLARPVRAEQPVDAGPGPAN